MEFLPLILLVLIFWLLIIRPMRKRQKEAAQIQQNLEIGVAVMMGSGIFGTVATISDDTVEITIAPGTNVTVHRQAISRVITADEQSQPPLDPPA